VTPWLITTFAPAVGRRMIWFLLSLPRHQVGVAAVTAGLVVTLAGLGLAMHRRRPSTSRSGST
jgi:hypothetical protein